MPPCGLPSRKRAGFSCGHRIGRGTRYSRFSPLACKRAGPFGGPFHRFGALRFSRRWFGSVRFALRKRLLESKGKRFREPFPVYGRSPALAIDKDGRRRRGRQARNFPCFREPGVSLHAGTGGWRFHEPAGIFQRALSLPLPKRGAGAPWIRRGFSAMRPSVICSRIVLTL